MSTQILTSFWLVSFLFVITPGVDWAYAISAGIKGQRVVPAVSGMLLGHLAVTILVAAGVGAFVSNFPVLLMTLTVLGAIYMLWLGVGLIRKPSLPQTHQKDLLDKSSQWLVTGFGISSLNPKVFLLILALLPQFFDAESTWPLSMQMLALGCIHITSSGLVYLLVGYSSERILSSRPRAARSVSQFSGLIMSCIAVALLAKPVLDSI